ncbi:hypothetical protein D6D19_08279 [Aureobasidium pullulans]|uniref:Extracellular membrane protein CFEM domain-containing protein n=1 Tax=Aureobasidium pullulans TaxID=5580 RepID=A0A4S8SF25_AURPU|nr:hypothetical protein D6D28_06077 [Aureobasidium pullulans]THW69600.1 hypothetical protein D6D19_08279 [Aureobasidium pullulans]THX54783.1 hypothetical protein D6D06_05296 [Aureobasidium pullulans]THZ14196.1 hypothetical protein D6C91_07447 [Aureobasidium pullulans]
MQGRELICKRMRYTTALLSLAALAAAQDCVSSYESCLTTQDENTCTSQLAVCKNLCANDLDTCNQSDAGSATCQKNYNSCLNTFPIIPGGSDCVAKYIKCGESGESDAVCNSQNAVCKDTCTNINSACLSSGSADVAACTKQYNACYYSTSDTITLDTVAKYQNCLNTGANVTSCNAQLTNFKDACTTIQATCLVSGSADSSFCSTLTAACYYNGSKWTRQSCSTAFSACTASDSECRAQLTQCKDTCTNAEASCNTAQNADKAACASVRSTCQGDSNDPITDPNVVSSSSAAASASANAKVAASSTMSVVAAVSTGGYSYANGTAGKNATSTYTPVAYTGAASKAGVSAIFAGVFGVAAYLL